MSQWIRDATGNSPANRMSEGEHYVANTSTDWPDGKLPPGPAKLTVPSPPTTRRQLRPVWITGPTL